MFSPFCLFAVESSRKFCHEGAMWFSKMLFGRTLFSKDLFSKILSNKIFESFHSSLQHTEYSLYLLSEYCEVQNVVLIKVSQSKSI